MRATDELIESIVNSSGIPSGRRQREVARELRAHVEDFVLAAREAGRESEEIERLVFAHFGDPGQIAHGFARVYRQERRRLRALAFLLSTLLLAGAILGAILVAQTGVAFALGRGTMHVLTSRHTMIEALDILASVAAYLGVVSLEERFETGRFQKASVSLTMIGIVLIALCGAMGLRVSFVIFGLGNGVFLRAIQLFVTRKAARAGVVAVCFALVGLVLATLRSPLSQDAVVATCVSWFAMGLSYQVMAHLASRLDAALVNGLGGLKRSS